VRYKLAVFDIDGTLIGPQPAGSSESAVPDNTAAAVRALAERGVTVAVGTARPYHIALGPFDEIGVAGEAITSSGADVRRADGAVVTQEPLSPGAARFLAELCDRASWSPTVATVDGVTMRLDKPPEWIGRAPATMRVVQSLADDVPAGMLAIVTGVDGDPAHAEELAAHPELSVNSAVTREGRLLLTVTRKDVDKGTGLTALCAALAISPDDAVAFGDADVDVPMFDAAGLSVAMGNSADDIKARADMVTDDVVADGLANAIKRIWDV